MKIERILIRGTNWIGDAVMSTPALQRLRSSFPQSHIALLTSPRTVGLFESSPSIDEVIEYARQEEGARAFYGAVKKIRAGHFDLALLFQNAFEAALLARLGGAHLRIGYEEQGRGALLTHKIARGPQHRNRHQSCDYLDLVAESERVCLGPEFRPAIETPPVLLAACEMQRNAALELFESLKIDMGDRSIVTLNVGATNSRAKCWPEDRYAALADFLIDEMNPAIVMIGAHSERASAEGVIGRMKRKGAINLAGKTNMRELIGLLDLCSLLVSNDTGPAHISAALNRPTLTIFGPTNEFETAPAGERIELIRAEGIECARCMHKDCPIDHRCMTRISAEEVFNCALKLLKGKSEGK